MEEPNNDFTGAMRLAFIHDNLKASKDPKSNFLKRSQKLEHWQCNQSYQCQFCRIKDQKSDIEWTSFIVACGFGHFKVVKL